MRTFVLLIFSFLAARTVAAQNGQIDYTFINAALPQLLNSCKTKPEFLASRTYRPVLQESEIDGFLKQLKGLISVKELKELVAISRSGSMTESQFDSDSIRAIKVIGDAQVDALQQANNRYASPSIYCTLSLPIINSSRTVAIIDFGVGTAVNRRVGSLYLFRKANGRWKLIKSFSAWAS